MMVLAKQRRGSEVLTEDDVGPEHPDQVRFNLCKKHLMTTPVFRHVRTDEEIREELARLDLYQPPDYILTNFPFYCSGRSYSGGPLWIVEAGKFDVRAFTNQPPEIVNALDKYLVQVFTYLVNSMVDNSRNGRMCRIQAVLDFEGMSFWKIATPSALALVIKVCSRYKDVLDELLHEALLVNVNSVVEMVLNRASPFLGQLMKKLKVYGRNDLSWLQKLESKFPSAAIPESYGGTYRCLTMSSCL